MKRRRFIIYLTLALLLLALPQHAAAHNCSSLSDCYSTIEAAIAAAAAAGILASLVSLGLDFVPGIGTIKGIIESVTGRDLITGEKIPMWARVLGVVPFAGGALKKLAGLGEAGVSVATRSRNILDRLKCVFTGHPVDVVTGKVFTEAQDFALPGLIPFAFERVWFSTSTYDGPLGRGWHHNFDWGLIDSEDGVSVRLADGRGATFPPIVAGASVFNRREQLTLLRYEQGYSLITADRHILRFAPAGRPNGEHSLVSVEDYNGNRIRLERDGLGRLRRIIDTDGRSFEFRLDASGRIAALTAPHPNVEGQRVTVAAYEYGAQGDLVAATNALNQTTRYAYANHLLTRETNRNGLSFYFEYEGADENAWCVHTWGDGGIYDHKLTYNREARQTIVENSLGGKTVFDWADSGLVKAITDALGGVTRFEWDADGYKLSETDPTGRTTRWEYNERGDAVRNTDAAGHATQYTYDQNGLLTEIIDRTGNRWRRGYDGRGNLNAVEDPAANRWVYESDGRGRLARVVDPLGSVFAFRYGDQNRNVRSRDWEEHVSVSQNDLWGRPILMTDTVGRNTGIEYDALNRVVGFELPDKSRVAVVYDGEGNVVQTSRNGTVEQRSRYGGLNWLVGRMDANGRQQQFNYDTEGNLVEVVNEKGEVWRARRDPLHRTVEEQTFDGRRIRLEYDGAGRRTRYVENSGNSLAYRYDANGHLVEKEWSDGEVERFEYDPEGRLLGASDNRQRIVFARDALNRVLSESRAGQSVESVYDSLGRRTQRRDGWRGETVYEYDRNGDVKSIRFPSGAAVEFERNATGAEVRRLLPGGAELRALYGLLGELRERHLYRANEQAPASTWNFDYDAAGEVVRIDSSAWGDSGYKYDASGRLVEFLSPEAQETYQYDPAGNLLAAGNTAFQYGAGNRLERYDGVEFDYDADGRIVRRTERDHAGVKEWLYKYTASGRLREVIDPAGQIITFEYDPFGRRTSKRVAGIETQFWWDEDEFLGEEVEGERRRFWYDEGFWPEEFRMEPLALEDARGLAFCICDHAGTLRETCSGDGDVTWSVNLRPFGAIENLRGDARSNPLRFPGQYHDADTGFHYNRFRYYDPRIGRYTTPDPAGLAGGLNEYAYGINPVSWIDPFGLTSIITPPTTLWVPPAFEASHSFPKYLLRALQKAGHLPPGARIPGQTTVLLPHSVHRAFHEAHELILPNAARHVGASGVTGLLNSGALTPSQIADALEKAAKQSMVKGTSELADTLSEIKRLRKCGGF